MSNTPIMIFMEEIIMGLRDYDQRQMFLLPPHVSDRIGKNDMVWLVDSLVNHLDITPVLDRYSKVGAEGYHPLGLIKVIFLGYTQGTTSSRKLESLCQVDCRYMYIMAMETPDHRTISDFRKDNLDFLKPAFQQMLQPLIKNKVVTLKRTSTDGSFILANASGKNVVRAENYDKLLRKLAASIDKYMEECDRVDEAEGASEGISDDNMKKIMKLMRKMNKIMVTREEMDKAGEEYRNVSDPDALFMGKRGERKRPRYNTQITVDNENQFIVAADVVKDCNDSNQLQPQIEQVIENTGKAPEQVLADSGYHNTDNIKFCEGNHIDCYIPDKRTAVEITGRAIKDNFYHKDKFAYDASKDCFLCPNGKELRLLKKTTQDGKQKLHYASPKACVDCPLAKECLMKGNKCGYRTINFDPEYDVIYNRMRAKMLTKEARTIYAERRCNAEPAFGDIKENMRCRQFHLRGLEAVKGEFLLYCFGHDIKRLHKILLEYASKLNCSLQKIIELFWACKLPELLKNPPQTEEILANLLFNCCKKYLAFLCIIFSALFHRLRARRTLFQN